MENSQNITQERSYKVENPVIVETAPDRLATALRWASNFRQTGYVYIIQAAHFIKVGVTHDVRRRLSMLQTGCPYNIELIAAIPCRDPYKAEQFIHDRLKPYHTRGEWFIAIRSEIDSAIFDLPA